MGRILIWRGESQKGHLPIIIIIVIIIIVIIIVVVIIGGGKGVRRAGEMVEGLFYYKIRIIIINK